MLPPSKHIIIIKRRRKTPTPYNGEVAYTYKKRGWSPRRKVEKGRVGCESQRTKKGKKTKTRKKEK